MQHCIIISSNFNNPKLRFEICANLFRTKYIEVNITNVLLKSGCIQLHTEIMIGYINSKLQVNSNINLLILIKLLIALDTFTKIG